jgi:hypothetical protein
MIDELELVFGTTAVTSVRESRQTPPAATAGVWHVATRDDSAVLKVVRSGGDEGRWPARDAETDPYYWKREPLAYTSGANAAFGVPQVRACVERPDGSVALWLEDCGEPPAPRTADDLVAIAERLGRAQAQPAPEHPWLGRGFLPEYLRLHGIDGGDEPDGPLVLTHNDFHPGNILANGAVIDWASCGLGAAGLDAGVLVVDALADEAVEDVDPEAVYAAYVDGYGAEARTGFLAGASRLRWLPRGRKAAWDRTLDLIERLRSEG